MKKFVSGLLCAALIMLPGCTGMAAETTPPTQPPAVEIPLETAADERPYLGVALEFQSMWAESAPEAAVLTQAAEVFEKRTGAEIQIFWNGETAENADIVQIPAGNLTENGASLLDLTDLAAASDYEAHSFPVLRQQVINACGHLAAIPQVPYLEGLYYSAEAFEACGIEDIPATWAEFLLACESLQSVGFLPLTMDGADAAGVLEMHLKSALGTDRLQTLCTSGGWQEDEGAVNAFQQITELVSFGYVGTNGKTRIALSNAAMFAGSNADCRQIEAEAKMTTCWGVMAWPGSGEGCGVFAAFDALAIRTGCENPQAAFAFILLLTMGDFDQLRVDVTGGIPADPANGSAITGAAEVLQGAAPMADSLLAPNELYSALWKGQYGDGALFAAALDAPNG